MSIAEKLISKCLGESLKDGLLGILPSEVKKADKLIKVLMLQLDGWYGDLPKTWSQMSRHAYAIKFDGRPTDAAKFIKAVVSKLRSAGFRANDSGTGDPDILFRIKGQLVGVNFTNTIIPGRTNYRGGPGGVDPSGVK